MRESMPVCSRFTVPLVKTTLRPLQPTLLNKMMEGRENSCRLKIYLLSDTCATSTRHFPSVLKTILTCPVVCTDRMMESDDKRPMASVLGYSPWSSTYMFPLNLVSSYATQLKHNIYSFSFNIDLWFCNI